MPPQAPYPPQGGYDPRYDQGHHGHGYRPHHKRKTSWLEEIFD
jgi:Zn-finger nucleic acid-binding protein